MEIQEEVRRLYAAFSQGRPPRLPELPHPVRGLLVLAARLLQGDVRQSQLSYWKEELGGAQFMLELPADKPRPARRVVDLGATEFFELPADLLERLKSLGREEQATLFMVLEAALAAMLQRYTGQDDILVGTPISGRTSSETENLIGSS